jgi:hypothetical protein
VKLVHLVGFIVKKIGFFLLSVLFNFPLKYAIRKGKAIHKLLKFNGTQQVVIMLMLIYGVTAYTP